MDVQTLEVTEGPSITTSRYDRHAPAIFRVMLAQYAPTAILPGDWPRNSWGGVVDPQDESWSYRNAAADGPDEYACTNPEGHKWFRTGTAFGGDDERWGGEGRCYCTYCGADGDA